MTIYFFHLPTYIIFQTKNHLKGVTNDELLNAMSHTKIFQETLKYF